MSQQPYNVAQKYFLHFIDEETELRSSNLSKVTQLMQGKDSIKSKSCDLTSHSYSQHIIWQHSLLFDITNSRNTRKYWKAKLNWFRDLKEQQNASIREDEKGFIILQKQIKVN